MASRGRQILLFLLLTFAFSCLPYYLIIHAGHLRVGNGMGGALIMWCPGFAAIITCLLSHIDIGSLGWNWRPTRYQVWSYVIPILYALPVYVGVWALIGGSFAFHDFARSVGTAFGFPHHPTGAALFLAIPTYATVGVIGGMARTLGEEIGWRGFLFPRLAEATGFTWGCVLSGCIWALWHYPALLFADYNAGTSPVYALTCFTLMVIAAAFIWGWLRLKSGNLWTSVILHASHNVFIQAIYDGMTKPVGRTLYITTEFGVGLVVTMWVVALYLWMRRGEVSIPSDARLGTAVIQL
jgi:membrane protease YdiL (CAAX protease family)